MRKLAYREVYAQIKGKIEKGVYAAGSMLPIEAELEAEYGVSRTTVRKAVKLLAEDGLVDVCQGRGTTVLDSKTPQSFNSVTSVTESLRQKGYRVETKSRYVDRITPDPAVEKALRLSPGEQVVRVQRVQTADGEPVCIMMNYIPLRLVPDMDQRGDSFTALYQYLEKTYGIVIDSTDDTIYAAAADFAESQILQVNTGFPILVVERVCYDENGSPLCVDHVKILSNRYKVQISAKGRSKQG